MPHIPDPSIQLLKSQLLDAIALYGLKLDEKRRTTAKASPAEFEERCYEWLLKKAPVAKTLTMATHVSKLTHPDAPTQASLIDTGLPAPAGYVATSSLPEPAIDFTGNAAALPVANLLRTVFDGKPLYQLLQEQDPRLPLLLGRNPVEARKVIEQLSAVRTEGAPVVSPVLKQVFWLTGEDATDDAQFHLLIPLTSSSLAQVQYERLKDRFSEEAKEARNAHEVGKPSELVDRRYPTIRSLRIGGAKPQNISALHKAREGELQMFCCAPPIWRSSDVRPILNRESIFAPRGIFRRRPGVTQALEGMAGYLRRRYLPANAETRKRVAGYVHQLVEELICLSVEYAVLPAGWSRDPACRLHPSQKLLLDPESRGSDEELAKIWRDGTWASDIGGWVSLLLVEHLRDAGIEVEEVHEGAFWARVIASGLLAYARGLPEPAVPQSAQQEAA